MARTKVQLVGDVNGGANFSGIVTSNTLHVGSSGTVFYASVGLSSVGVGTTNPKYTLDVVGDINLSGTFRQGGTQFVASRWTTGIGDDIYRLSGDVGIGTTNPIGQLQISSGPVIVGAATSTGTASQTLQVTGGAYVSGSLGIGRTNPGVYGLDVAGVARIGGTSTGKVSFGTGQAVGDFGISILPYFDRTDLQAEHQGVAYRPLILNPLGGNIGIGTTNPSTTLQVNGTATVTTLVETSSITLKENINPIVNALDKVVQLNPVTYDRKSGESKNEAGLIAEEVNDIIPNIVSKDDEGNPNGINYTKLSVYLIDAIKELKKQIDELKG